MNLFSYRFYNLCVTLVFIINFNTALALNADVKAKTPQGNLIGLKLGKGEEKVIYAFKGIPYAVPPVGERRWKAAEAAPGWQGDRLAYVYGPDCMQWINDPSFLYRPGAQMSEDCLYLNVWTPTLNTDKKLPVMVWFHGGGLVYGASSYTLYDGTELARKDVVVVNLNYRLNIFGFFALPELSRESPHGVSGNYAITDQIKALDWVQKNIAAFGGDPDNVTVFGESAGAQSISHLLASPLTTDLFHKAIMESGVLRPIPALKEKRLGKEPAEETGLHFAERLGKKKLSQLRAMTANDLLLAARDYGFVTEAVEDNWILPEQIIDVFAQGRQHDIPIVAGFNSGEGYIYFFGREAPIPSDAQTYLAAVEARYGDLAEEYISIYPPNDLREAFYAPLRDGNYGWASESFVRSSQRRKSNSYLYYFDHIFPWAERMGMGAYHTSELLFVFNNMRHNFKYSPRWPDYSATKGDLALAETMSNYWVAFAKLGKPTVEGQPKWSPYTNEARHYMAFKKGLAVPSRNLHPGVWELHKKIFADRRARDTAWGYQDIGLLAPKLPGAQMQ